MSRRNNNDSLIFDSLQLEGGLFVPAILEKAARGEHEHQKPADYALPKGISLTDEQGRSFRIASALWKSFQPVRERSDIDAQKATQGFVIELLRDTLGYSDIQTLGEPVEISERAYPIQLMARGRVPIVVAPHTLELDTPDEQFAVTGSGARRKSAYQLAQQFLNASDPCAWAIAINGLKLRLLRDADTLTRPSYLEVDLERILKDNSYADFAALWRLLHATRAGAPDASGEACVWETWKLEGQAQGQRVRNAMRIGVTDALKTLGDGFLQYSGNRELHDRLQDGSLTVDAYFQQILRLVYRFLFLFTVEEREQLHVKDLSTRGVAARRSYAEGYSMRRLRDRALRRIGFDKYTDLWEGIRIVFRGLQEGQAQLALPALGGLFADDQCPDLERSQLDNRALLQVMRHLRWSSASGHLSAVDFRNMGPEELGSVYESLLELVPTVDLPTKSFGFVGITDEGSSDGNARKTSGSYYTPDSLVQQLLDTALDPVIEQRIADNPENPTQAILDISVIDPACGSGHFLLGAARRLAERLAELRAVEGAVQKEDYYHALREVINNCIYGVDRNPMALELARTALWLEGYEPGQPLSFLGHHLVCGDALLGLTDFKQLEHGIPKDAFKPLSGDSKSVCKELNAVNTVALKDLKKRLKDKTVQLFSADEFEDIFATLDKIEKMPDDTTRRVRAKQRAYVRFLEEAQDSALAHAADLVTAAYLTPKSDAGSSRLCPTTDTLLDLLFPEKDRERPTEVIEAATQRSKVAKVLHWPLAFAQIFSRGGFDCVLGNPPWERIKLQEEEFFATRQPHVTAAKNKAERTQRITWLSEGSLAFHLFNTEIPHGGDRAEIQVYQDFIAARRLAEAMSAFAHVKGKDGGRYPLTGIGDVNTYALFAETIQQINSPKGRAGFIVPGGIATDHTTKVFFGNLVKNRNLITLYGFDNQKRIFEQVHPDTPFVLMTIGNSTSAADLTSYLLDITHLDDKRRHFSLDAEDFTLINPNTLTCPVFRAQADAELTKKIYRHVSVLIKEATEECEEVNPWGIRFSRMLDMANDSGLFHDEAGDATLPLYEAKMMHQFDHRWASYFWNTEKNANDSKLVESKQKADLNYQVQPRYWVDERQVIARIARAPKCVIQAWLANNAATLLKALANWIESANEDELLSGFSTETSRQRVIAQGGQHFEQLPKAKQDWFDEKAQSECRAWDALTESELDQIQNDETIDEAISSILDARSPRWLMGWRDVTNATNQRTVIAAVVPRVAVNDKLLLMFPNVLDSRLNGCLLADQNSLVHDFIARQKIGGTALKYFTKKQLPHLPPEAYAESDLDYIVPRVLELTYTSHDLAPWAADLGYTGEPFGFNPERRAQIRAELDAYYAKLYGLTRDELRYILDPADIEGEDYPSETFRGLKNKDIKNYGEYRTQRLVLGAWDALEGGASEESIEIEVTELRLPEIPRVAYASAEIKHYTTYLIYAWIANSSHVKATEMARAFSLLKQPKALVKNFEGDSLALAKVWLKAFKEPIANVTLRPALDGLLQRGELKLTRNDRDECIFSLSENATLPPKAEWIALDAQLSLESALNELAQEPAMEEEEVELIDFLDQYLINQK